MFSCYPSSTIYLAPQCSSCLFLSCLSIFAHLPSYNPFRLWLLCKFLHFLSLYLIPSLSFSPSCLPLRQPEYDNVISHSSTSPPPPPLCLCLFVLSLYRLLTLLPSMSPCLSCSYFESQTMHTYAHTRLQIVRATHATLSNPPSCAPSLALPPLHHFSNFLTHPSSPCFFFYPPPSHASIFLSYLFLPLSISLKPFLCISLSPYLALLLLGCRSHLQLEQCSIEAF